MIARSATRLTVALAALVAAGQWSQSAPPELIPPPANAPIVIPARLQQPPLTTPVPLVTPAPAGVPVIALTAKPCCLPKVIYRGHPLHRKKHLKHQPQMDVVLAVPTPCSCCHVPVKVCVPACCAGVPKMECHRGLLGRHVVEYCWENGFRVKMVFTKHGDKVVVHSLGA